MISFILEVNLFLAVTLLWMESALEYLSIIDEDYLFSMDSDTYKWIVTSIAATPLIILFGWVGL